MLNKINNFIKDNGIEGCDYNTLNIYKNCVVKENDKGKEGLFSKGNHYLGDKDKEDNYFVNQWTGYSCDDYYGYVYIPTDEKGTYIELAYEC